MKQKTQMSSIINIITVILVVGAVAWGVVKIRSQWIDVKPIPATPQLPSLADYDDAKPESADAKPEPTDAKPEPVLAREDIQHVELEVLDGEADTYKAEASEQQYAKDAEGDWADHEKPKPDDYSAKKSNVAYMEGSLKKSFKGDYGKYDGVKVPMRKISVGPGEDIFITGEGEHWHVSTAPDGTTSKTLLRTENIDGEVVITGSEETNVYRPTPKNNAGDSPQK